MIGTISGESVHLPRMPGHVIDFCASIRTKIRDEIDGYSASADYWLRCLYEGERGNPEDVEKGFLKSELLVRVCASTTVTKCSLTLNSPSRRLNSYSHHHLRQMVTSMSLTTVRKGANPPAQVLQNVQITQKSMG